MKKIILLLLIISIILGIINFITVYQKCDFNKIYADLTVSEKTSNTIKHFSNLGISEIAKRNDNYKLVKFQEIVNICKYNIANFLVINYIDQMYQCAITNNVTKGYEIAQKRNNIIINLNLNYKQFSFDDYILLSKVISTEAGDNRASLEWKMCVGEVVLNRVAHPLFPNSISEVVYQKGQYEGSEAYGQVHPTPLCYEAAARLLKGERVFNDINVVFQANFTQGHGIVKIFTLSPYPPTYFCYY